MLFFSFLFISFIFDENNVEELAKKSYDLPVFALFYSQHCGHCKAMMPLWNIFRLQFQNDDKVIIAESDCSVHRAACNRFMKITGYPTFGIIRKNETTTSVVDRNIESWTKLANKLKSFDPNYRCKIWLAQTGVYPSFVYQSPKSAEETCDEIQVIIQKLPKTRDIVIYADPEGKEYSCQINVSPEVGFVLENQTNYTRFIPFIEDYSLSPLGNWEIHEAVVSDRRIAFVIYSSPKHLRAFQSLAYNQSGEILFGKIEFNAFSKMFPELELQIAELPAIGISNYNQSRFMILTNVKVKDELYHRLDGIVKKNEDLNMTISMSKILKVRESILMGIKDDNDDMKIMFGFGPVSIKSIVYVIVIALIVLAVIMLTIGICGNGNRDSHRRRNRVLFKAFANFKYWLNEIFSRYRNSPKTPVTLL